MRVLTINLQFISNKLYICFSQALCGCKMSIHTIIIYRFPQSFPGNPTHKWFRKWLEMDLERIGSSQLEGKFLE